MANNGKEILKGLPPDRGGLTVMFLTDDEKVIMSFGDTEVAWLGLPPPVAREVAQKLLDHACEIDGEARVVADPRHLVS